MKLATLLLATCTFALFAFSAPTKSTFIKNDEVFVISDSSAPKEITQDGIPKSLPVWSKDGKEIAFLRKIGPEKALANLVVVDSEGIPKGNVLIRPAESALPNAMRFVETIQWLSDSKIALGGSSNPSLTETLVVNPISGAVLDDIYDDGGGPVFSPDGNHVAYEDGMPHFTPEEDWKPRLNIDDKPVFPTGDGHFVFLTPLRWSPNSTELAVVVGAFGTKNTSLVLWHTTGPALILQLQGPADSQMDTFWAGNDLFVVSNSHTWELPAGASQLTETAPHAMASPVEQAYRTKKNLEPMIERAGGKDADFWCESCPLVNLPRKVTVNK